MESKPATPFVQPYSPPPSALPLPPSSWWLLRGARNATVAVPPQPSSSTTTAAAAALETVHDAPSPSKATAPAEDLSNVLARLALAHALPTKLRAPPTVRKKLLVLDANGFLCWRARRGDAAKPLPSRPCDLSEGEFRIYLRPSVRDFLEWCALRFHVIMWSTAMRRNVEPIVRAAFGPRLAPAAVFDQADCDDTGLAHPDNPHKRLLLKRLPRLWADPRVAQFLGGYGPADTLLIDDSPYKAAANPEHTAVHPPEWSALDPDDAPNSTALAPGGEIRRLLAIAADAADMRAVVHALMAGAARGGGSPLYPSLAPPDFWQRPEEDAILRMVRGAMAAPVAVA